MPSLPRWVWAVIAIGGLAIVGVVVLLLAQGRPDYAGAIAGGAMAAGAAAVDASRRQAEAARVRAEVEARALETRALDLDAEAQAHREAAAQAQAGDASDQAEWLRGRR